MKKLFAALLALALALALAGCGGEGASEIVQVPLDSLGEVRAMGEKCLEQLSEQEDGLPMSAEIREFDTFPEAVDCAGCGVRIPDWDYADSGGAAYAIVFEGVGLVSVQLTAGYDTPEGYVFQSVSIATEAYPYPLWNLLPKYDDSGLERSELQLGGDTFYISEYPGGEYEGCYAYAVLDGFIYSVNAPNRQIAGEWARSLV